MSNRIVDHPILGRLEERERVVFTFDGREYEGLAGDTIASALLANDVRVLRVHEESGAPRGIYCNIGHCFECRVTVDGVPGVRACLTEIRPGMVVERGSKLPAPLKTTGTNRKLPRTYSEFLRQQEEGGDSHD
jgi:sarcosine oxidase subunit alpha